MLNQKPEDKYKITIDDMIDKFFNLFNATIDTTTSLITFSCYMLIKHPEIHQ